MCSDRQGQAGECRGNVGRNGLLHLRFRQRNAGDLFFKGGLDGIVRYVFFWVRVDHPLH